MFLKLNRLMAYGKKYRSHSPFYYILKLFILYPVTMVASIAYTSGLVIYLVSMGPLGCVDSFAVCMKAAELTFLFYTAGNTTQCGGMVITFSLLRK